MLTTVTPEAHVFNILNNVVIPFKCAPYPILVGTAITGVETNPPTTQGYPARKMFDYTYILHEGILFCACFMNFYSI